MESEPMSTPREKSPLQEKFSSEEDGTHDAASSRTASPTPPTSYSGPGCSYTRLSFFFFFFFKLQLSKTLSQSLTVQSQIHRAALLFSQLWEILLSYMYSVATSIHNVIIIIRIRIIIIITFKGAIRDFLPSPHSAANCLQHARSSGPGATVCKSHATHRALITCKCHVTCHLVRRDSSAISLTELKSHLFELTLLAESLNLFTSFHPLSLLL